MKTALRAPPELLEAITLSATEKIRAAAEILEFQAAHIALIVDSQGVLLGTISDGDVRRGLLDGAVLTDPVTQIMHQSPIVALADVHKDHVSKMMNDNCVNQVPILDKGGKLCGLYLRGGLSNGQVRHNTVVIMAGGIGSRLRPHTEKCPKPMLELAGKPMLEHIILAAKHEGFYSFVITLNYLGHMIEDYFGDGAEYGVQITYTREEKPLGTAGALSLLDVPPTDPLLVTNGDIISGVRLGSILEFHESHGADATMAVRKFELQNPFGVVTLEGLSITGFEEKPVVTSNINAGVYVLNPIACTFPAGTDTYTMPELFEEMNSKGYRTLAYPLHENWLDVGRPSDYELAQEIKGGQ